MKHPREVLLDAQSATALLPVCDHYSGVEARMRKSLALQAEMTQEFGACVFDVTLDCEDGAAVGGELEHAQMVVALARDAVAAARASGVRDVPRVAARVHPVDHVAFDQDIQVLAGSGFSGWCHLMVPKIESVRDVDRAVAALAALTQPDARTLPIHVLLESPAAVHRAYQIAAHPRVQSVSFGLMDFVSAHGGAIPSSGMQGEGQFSHPLVMRAKLEIAAACHAAGKVPSHCVVTEIHDPAVVRRAAGTAARSLGYARMWSIHPAQIRPILEAFAPDSGAVAQAVEIIVTAQAAQWAPISHCGQLHDRASYRFFWQVLERAHGSGRSLPPSVAAYFETATLNQGGSHVEVPSA